MIELRLLGTIDLTSSDDPAAADLLASPSATAALAFLGASPRNGFIRRDSIVALFWPETSQAQARTNLRKVVHKIRTALGAEAIESRGDEDLRLSAARVWCDVAEFQSVLRIDLLERAMELYGGQLMPGFHLDGGGEFSRWLEETRLHLAREAGKAALRLAEQHLRAAQRTQASEVAQFIARVGGGLDDEFLFRKLLDLLIRLGNNASALKMYDAFRARLDELGGVPSPETRALIQQIKTV